MLTKKNKQEIIKYFKKLRLLVLLLALTVIFIFLVMAYYGFIGLFIPLTGLLLLTFYYALQLQILEHKVL